MITKNYAKDVTYIWMNHRTFSKRAIALNNEERFNHTYIIWKQDSYKKNLVYGMMLQDTWTNNNWFCVIDEYWEYTENFLKHIPKERAKDIVYFDAGNEDRFMGINLYDISSLDEASTVVEYTTEMFLKIFWPEIFGPRIQEYFKYASLALLEDFEDKPSFLDITRMFTDDAFREEKLSKVTNPIVIDWWERTYNAMENREKAEIIPYFSSKFIQFTTNWQIRNIIWQTRSAFNFNDIIDNKNILLINLAKDKIWETSASILGMILTYKLKLELAKRAHLSKEDKNPFFLYINNFQYILWTSYDNRLKTAKENKIWMILIHDFIEQIDTKNKEKDIHDILNNSWNICIFNTFWKNAEFFSKEFPSISKKDLDNLKEKEFIFKQSNEEPLKIKCYNNTSWPVLPKIEPLLKEYCSKKFWRAKAYIEAEFYTKYWIPTEVIELPGRKPEMKIIKKTITTKTRKKAQEVKNKEPKKQVRRKSIKKWA